ncbi:MAG: flagellar basal body P-ring formation chaperone FlgA [Desulfobacteraceae bacterium]|nr:flagellar basal body P-ring formation chaperone FlgA [Desulfobacteraceae bacterium]
MKRFVFCIFLILWLPSLVFGLEVRFRQSAEARSPMLTLEDVAEISPSSAAKNLGGIKLFPSPGPGERTCYKSATLKAYIRKALANSGEVKWGGAQRVCVRQAGSLVTPGEMDAVVNDRLRDALSSLSTEKAAFVFRNKPEPVSVPPGKVTYEVLFSDPDILGSRQATVIVKVDGQAAANVSIPGQIRAYLPVVAAAKKLRRGHVLTRQDVVTRAKNIAELNQPCREPEAVVGKRLKRSVAMGQVIDRRYLDRPVMVERRQMVTMVLKKGPLRIQARGTAAADGKKGEVVRVQNMRSGRKVPCRVIGNGLVKVVDF